MDNKRIARKTLLSISWPVRLSFLIVTLLAIAFIVVEFFLKPVLALVGLLILVCALGIGLYSFFKLINQTKKYLYDLSFREGRGKQEALIQMPIGMLLYGQDKRHTVEWLNPKLQEYFGKSDVIGVSLSDFNKELGEIVSHEGQIKPQVITLQGDKFKIYVQKNLRAIYLFNVTDYVRIYERYEAGKIAIGQIFLDNYDELTQTMSDRERSNLNSYVTNQLTDWANDNGMFLKRISKDQFIVVSYSNALAQVERERFSILDKIRVDTSKQNSPLTLSVGFAYGSDDLAEMAENSQKNLDLALGRGGDQVVVKKNGEQARFYGGNTNPMEKRTRVRARMICQALIELFHQSKTIYVMGHARPDMDALGSCLGIHRIAQMNDHDCKIVVDRENLHSDSKRLLKLMDQDKDLKDDIVTPEEALEQADSQEDLLVMVDHSKPSISMSPKLYDKLARHTVIIDHHRRGEEFPKNPILVYIEPYASSASELITELVEYQPQSKKSLNVLEATAMLAGITVDTRQFSLRAGTRTFDAASYLRSVGADGIEVQNLLKENINSYLQRNHLIDTIEMIESNIALCVGPENTTYDSVIAAQAADTLLSLDKVDASFVITKRKDGKIAISARSLGDFNVQVIMEKMGGGGHLSNAATQIADCTIAQAREQLIEIVKEKVMNDKKVKAEESKSETN